jgi:Uncharacterised nucleotidyltransferase
MAASRMSTQSATQTLVALLGERLGRPPAVLEGVDWPALVELARRNRVAALAQAALAGRPETPETARRELLALARRSFVETTLTAQALKDLAPLLKPMAWALLRGPVLGVGLYGDLMLRPYGDLDVLVAPGQVDEALRALATIGFALPASSLDARYYRAYHLHLALARPGPAGPLSVELHWAIDHPFSLTTVDVAGLLTRVQTIQVEGAAVPVPAPDDLILTLALHTLKHAVRLPYWVEIGQVEQVAQEESLLALLDVALAAQHAGPELDWEALARRAAEWGAAQAVRACLEAVEALWPGRVPTGERARFAARPLGRLQRAVYRRLPAGRSGAFALRQGAFFRPVRLLDAADYVFAPADYLRRRYGAAGPLVRLGHGLRAAGQLCAGGLALAYFTVTHALTARNNGHTTARPALPLE